MDTLIAQLASEAAQAGEASRQPHMLILNHPFWTYYDIVPRNVIDHPEIRFFEVCTGAAGSRAPHPQALTYTPEKFWDVVNAFRSLKGQPLLYGIGSDDAHLYDVKRIDGNNGVGDSWIMARAAALTPDDLIAAMARGDFYASSGVLLDDLAFSTADNTLRVKVKAEQGVGYRIHFITTKRSFDQTVTEIASPAAKGQPARSIPIYSDSIGRIAKTVAGTEAAYRLETDDLYVRASVESDVPKKNAPNFHPKVGMAWTQPYVGKGVTQ